jgi:hypothetical protein
VVVSTDAPCADVRGTVVAAAAPGASEQAGGGVSTSACAPDQQIGSVVLVPTGAIDAPLAVRVVTAIGVPIASCLPPSYGPGCVVARRSLRYLPHTRMTLPIVMRAACKGIACGPGTTCVEGACVSDAIDPSGCASAVGCGEGTLPTADAGADATLADAALADSSASEGGASADAALADGAACSGADLQTDAKNCGACGHDCLGATCNGGLCAPALVVTGLDQAGVITVDGNDLFLLKSGTTGPDGFIWQAPKTGGAAIALVSNFVYPASLAVSPTDVFFPALGAHMNKVPRSGGPITQLPPTLGANPFQLAIDSTYVYWMSGGGPETINRMALDGSGPTPIVTQDAIQAFAIDGAYVYFATGPRGGTGTITRVPVGTGAPLDLGKTSVGTSAVPTLDVRPTAVVWSDSNPVAIRAVSPSGGPTRTLAVGGDPVTQLVFDGTTIYFLAYNHTAQTGLIGRVALAGGPVTPLTGASTIPIAMAVDDAYVYWIEYVSGKITAVSRVAK